jgi:hypothetical protein
VDYVTCNADAPNNANSFTAASSVGGFTNVVVTTVNNAFGGAERETVQSVKFSATKNFEAQNRAVTASDYGTIIRRDFPNVDSVAVWGGENSDPPVYGKVFISLKPKSGFVITNSTKQTVINTILSPFNVVTVLPEIIDPDYIFVEIVSLVKFSPPLTTLPADQIRQLVVNTINNFATTDVNQFDRIFRYSVLGSQIDLSETSITNDLTNIRIQKRFTPVLQQFQNFTLSFNPNNSIVPSTVTSAKFVVKQDPTYTQTFKPGDLFSFDDDGLGNLRVSKQVGTQKVIVKAKAGTVDYTNGILQINNFIPDSVVDPSGVIKISAEPVINDITPVRNNIIFIDPLDVQVTMSANPTIVV